MKSVHNIWLFGILNLIACGSSNQIKVSVPNVISSSVNVVSLETKKVLSQKQIKDEIATFSGAEIGLGSIELEVDHGLKAIISEGANFEQINVNPITTLAACRIKSSEEVFNESLVIEQNKLIAKQFMIADLHLVHPNMNLKNIQSLDSSSMYGLLVEGFEALAKKMNVKSSTLLEALCLDVKFDGVFNEIDDQGLISNRLYWYDEQLLKSRYANAIYTYAKENLKNFSDLPIGPFVNEVSLSAQKDLFPTNVANYPFDQDVQQ